MNICELTGDNKTFPDRSNVWEEMLQLVSACLRRNIGDLDGAPATTVIRVDSHRSASDLVCFALQQTSN